MPALSVTQILGAESESAYLGKPIAAPSWPRRRALQPYNRLRKAGGTITHTSFPRKQIKTPLGAVVHVR